jgi:hypothetical protein
MLDPTSTQSASGSGNPVMIEEENWYHDVEIVDNARTLELSAEDAERLMPEPTVKIPWFGYDSFADYGEDGLDAVADNDDGETGPDTDGNGGAGAPGPSGSGMGAKIDVDIKIVTGDNPTISEDNDIADVKGNTADVDSHASEKRESGTVRAEPAEGSGSGGGETKAKKE